MHHVRNKTLQPHLYTALSLRMHIFAATLLSDATTRNNSSCPARHCHQQDERTNLELPYVLKVAREQGKALRRLWILVSRGGCGRGHGGSARVGLRTGGDREELQGQEPWTSFALDLAEHAM